mmetsp:Transcript_46868/g.133974  ORF Transcript_46868/g.133974 Transcript_46868/m.133974 type:complete len:81 (+) Transcript_46868:267-509(+)
MSVMLPLLVRDLTLSMVPGRRRLSFSLPKKEMAEMSQEVFDWMVMTDAPAPQLPAKPLATAMLEVQLDTPHQVTVLPGVY